MRFLVDTNVIVRSVERAHPLMRIARDAMRQLYSEGHELCVVPQVISEFWNVCTRPQKMNGLGLDISATDRLVVRIEALFSLLPDAPEAYRAWRELIVNHQVKGAKVHDTRLVAMAMVHELDGILTFNSADFKRYGKLRAIDPSTLL